MAKRLAQFMSAANRHNPSAAASAAAGVSNAATTRAMRWFVLRRVVLERLTNRILTRMTLCYQSINFCAASTATREFDANQSESISTRSRGDAEENAE